MSVPTDSPKRRVCWDCGDYTTVYTYGVNGLCLSCLEEREHNEVDDDRDNDKNKILPIGRRARAYIEFLSKNDRTSPTYNGELNEVIADDLALVYDRIDKCKKYDFSYLDKWKSKKMLVHNILLSRYSQLII